MKSKLRLPFSGSQKNSQLILINYDFLRAITSRHANRTALGHPAALFRTASTRKVRTMSNITLSAGVRQNLLSLQQTSAQELITQNDLATGKKVNSALDNPSSYFTSQSLDNRASDLGTLLDQIGQAVQTLNAANDGITSLTSLVQSAKSIATQAQEATKGTVNYTNITGNLSGNGIATDQSQVTGTYASGGTDWQQSVLTINASTLSGVTEGDTVTLSNGTTSTTFQYVTGTNSASGNNVGFSNAATLRDRPFDCVRRFQRHQQQWHDYVTEQQCPGLYDQLYGNRRQQHRYQQPDNPNPAASTGRHVQRKRRQPYRDVPPRCQRPGQCRQRHLLQCQHACRGDQQCRLQRARRRDRGQSFRKQLHFDGRKIRDPHRGRHADQQLQHQHHANKRQLQFDAGWLERHLDGPGRYRRREYPHLRLRQWTDLDGDRGSTRH